MLANPIDHPEDQASGTMRGGAFRRLLEPILAEVEADDRGFVSGTQIPIAALPRIAQKVRELSASGQRRARWLSRSLSEKTDPADEMIDGISIGALRRLTAENPNPEAAAVRHNIETMKLARAEGEPVVETKLMSGNQFDRLAGLEPLSVICRGRSVLDVGCHRGLISYEAARFGATLVHGIDLYPQGIAAAREIFTDTGIPNAFVEFDLSLGRAALLNALADVLLPRYGVVLLLAVLQHLRRQMDGKAATDLLDLFIERTETYLVLRLPNLELIQPQLSRHGFRSIYFNHIDKSWRRLRSTSGNDPSAGPAAMEMRE